MYVDGWPVCMMLDRELYENAFNSNVYYSPKSGHEESLH